MLKGTNTEKRFFWKISKNVVHSLRQSFRGESFWQEITSTPIVVGRPQEQLKYRSQSELWLFWNWHKVRKLVKTLFISNLFINLHTMTLENTHHGGVVWHLSSHDVSRIVYSFDLHTHIHTYIHLSGWGITGCPWTVSIRPSTCLLFYKNASSLSPTATPLIV